MRIQIIKQVDGISFNGEKIDRISFNGKAGLTEQFKQGGVFAWRNRLVQVRLAGLRNSALKAA